MPQSNGTVLTETIAAAAVAALAIAGVLFFLYRFLVARRSTKGKENGSFRRKEVENVKVLIVSENGVVVIVGKLIIILLWFMIFLWVRDIRVSCPSRIWVLL